MVSARFLIEQKTIVADSFREEYRIRSVQREQPTGPEPWTSLPIFEVI